MYKAVTFIGSREASEVFKREFCMLACAAIKQGFVIRSGSAPGPDSWAEEACFFMAGRGFPQMLESYLPWKGFEDRYGERYRVLDDTMTALAADLLHNSGVCTWQEKVSQGIRKLFRRNVYQIIGYEYLLSKAVVYVAPEKNGKVSGGTAIAVNLARAFGIPCFNLALRQDLAELEEILGISLKLDELIL